LQPGLALSYNSQIADGFTSSAQASWVGLGWSLGESYIQRSQSGTRDDLQDDTFTLQVNGVSGLLMPIENQDGDSSTDDYRLQEDNFWRIRRYKSQGTVQGGYGDSYNGDQSIWVAWDKTGTQYTFEQRAYYPDYEAGYDCDIRIETWQWSLSKVRDVYGNEMVYTYAVDEENRHFHDCDTDWVPVTLAVYPYTITYANGRYRVRFEKESRTDYKTAWNSVEEYRMYMRYRLNDVLVEHEADGQGNNFEQTVRKYDLEYGERSQQLFPGVDYGTNRKVLTLTSIGEYGLNGAGPLPVTEFTYGDDMHLTLADNGYGGRVEFDYEELPWNELTSGADPVKEYTGPGKDDQHDDIMLFADAWHQAGEPALYSNPGQLYYVSMDYKWNDYGSYHKLHLGLNCSSGTCAAEVENVTQSGNRDDAHGTGTVMLPA
jgi:hypothetical protein